MLLHEKVAPLNPEGFNMVASLNNPARMNKWLRRLVTDRGGWVEKTSLLKEFSVLVFKDGHPTMDFDRLLEKLSRKTWIDWRVGRKRKCKEGHMLQLLGTGSYRPDDGWYCN